MNNPSPNNQRNMRRAVALLAIVLALLLCFRLCKRKTTEDPIPPPTEQGTTSTKVAPNMPLGKLALRKGTKGTYVQGKMLGERA